MWDIKLSEDDNNVEFYISKELKEVGEESVSTIKVIVFISLIVLGIVILFVRKNLKTLKNLIFAYTKTQLLQH